MHELAIVSDMIEAISERMTEFPDQTVRRIVIEIGAGAALLPDAMSFSFEVARRDTALACASLEIIETEGAGITIKELEIE